MSKGGGHKNEQEGLTEHSILFACRRLISGLDLAASGVLTADVIHGKGKKAPPSQCKKSTLQL